MWRWDPFSTDLPTYQTYRSFLVQSDQAVDTQCGPKQIITHSQYRRVFFKRHLQKMKIQLPEAI